MDTAKKGRHLQKHFHHKDWLYFVDEAGHDSMYDRRGRIIAGTEGCSHTFMVGFAEIPSLAVVSGRLEALRQQIIVDPELSQKPSLRPEAKKTACCFHASKDLPVVRERVIRLLNTFPAQVHVGFRRKKDYLDSKTRESQNSGRTIRWSENDLYDTLVCRVAARRFKRPGHHHLLLARRGKGVQRKALTEALEQTAQICNAYNWVSYEMAQPTAHPGLQVIDYYLWALQRALERGDWEAFKSLQGGYEIIGDFDDTTTSTMGRTYTRDDPFTPEKLKPIISG